MRCSFLFFRRKSEKIVAPMLLPKNMEVKKQHSKMLLCLFFTGGEEGIRTPGTLRYTSFPGAHNRPLCHLSIL